MKKEDFKEIILPIIPMVIAFIICILLLLHKYL